MDLRPSNSRDNTVSAENLINSSKYVMRGAIKCQFPIYWVEAYPYVTEVEGVYCRGKIGQAGISYCFVQAFGCGSIVCRFQNRVEIPTYYVGDMWGL